MALHTSPSTIALDAIALEDTTFVITFGRSCETLARAIDLAGLLNPPVLAKVPEQDSYRIVSGFLRIQALRTLGCKEIPARVLEPSCNDLQALELALCDNMGHRPLNSVEQAGAVKRLLGYLPEKRVVDCWLPLLGLRPSAKAFESCLRIDSLERPLKQALAAGTISSRSAAELAGLSPADRLTLFRLFSDVHLSTSKQAEIIETCKDLVRRDGTDIPALLGAEKITDILSDPNRDRSHKGEQVRQLLRRCRYPRLTKKEEQFSALQKKLPRAGNVRLVHPQSFEGNTYHLEIAFSQPGSLTEAAETVRDLAHDARMNSLFGDGQ